jgi:hypothetical protein
MAAVWRSLGWDLRARWRPLLGLAILLGIVGGTVLASAAGARRTDTALPRLRAWAHASQVQVILGQPGRYARTLRHLAGVMSVGISEYVDAMLPAGHAASVTAIASPDNSYGVRTDAVRILDGRMWRPGDPHAAMVDAQLAAAAHLHPGSQFRLKVIPQAAGTGNAEPNLAVTLRLRVSAIVVFDFQVPPATAANAKPTVLLSPPFARSALAQRASYGTELSAQLQPGASVSSVIRSAEAAASQEKTVGAGNFNVVDLSDQVDASQQSIRPEAIALAAFALLAGLILLAVIGQLFSRQLVLDAADFPVLRALGMSPRQLLVLMVTRLLAITLAGGVLAVIIAVLASPLMPIGPARAAEPHPGVEANLAILGAGVAVIVLAPLALVLPAAWRIAARPEPYGRGAGQARQPGFMSALGRQASVTCGTGLRLAFQPGRGRSAVPVRSAQLGTIVAVGATVAALCFSGSFLHLLATPAQYGQNWQQDLDLSFGAISAPLVSRVAAVQPGLQAFAAGDYGQITVNGAIVPAVGLDVFRGGGFSTLLSGRAPAAKDEIALGAHTMRRLGLRLGQRVKVSVGGQAGYGQRAAARPMRIVGVAVLPAFGQGSIIATNLGSGALVRAATLSIPYPQTGCPGTVTCYNFILARYRQGTSGTLVHQRLLTTIDKLGCPPQVCHVISDQRPTDIVNYDRVRQTPLLLGLVLALLAIGTLGHVLLTSVRRRARDLAVLKVLGMGRRQVLRVLIWQALAFSVAAVAVGLPLGLLAGRWAWILFADSAGAPADPVVPFPALLVFIPATLALAAIVAALPGRAAGRLTPAAVLRSE